VSTVALAVPNLDQGRFLRTALDSARSSSHDVRLAVLDAGSRDGSLEVIADRADALAYWRSRQDEGQAAAVNEGVRELCARVPSVHYVGWLNADDFFLPDGLTALADALDAHLDWIAVAGEGVLADEQGRVSAPIGTEPFRRERFATRCTICQPATLVRREAWEAVGGLDASLDMCFDYDLWWRLAAHGAIGYLGRPVAASRDHSDTKTRGRRPAYFREAKRIVAREMGRVPWHWYISEALEQEVGYRIGVRPGFGRRVRAAARAALSFARDRATDGIA
jgi:GT2 family glycosyltransferase